MLKKQIFFYCRISRAIPKKLIDEVPSLHGLTPGINDINRKSHTKIEDDESDLYEKMQKVNAKLHQRSLLLMSRQQTKNL